MAGVRYPTPGCIVEYMEGNAPQIALVMEENGGQLRLLLPNRRETRLAASRVLPWLGPLYKENLNKEESLQLLDRHKKNREETAASVATLEAWETAQGEVVQASAQWFAELYCDAPDEDTVAAYGRALLLCKSHFRFQPPDFQIYPKETAEKRLAEQKARESKESLLNGGGAFLRLLWDAACKKRILSSHGDISIPECSSPDVAERLKSLLYDKMRAPENQEHDALWGALTKGLPDLQHLPLQLLTAWGEVPEHYNFWMDRAGYTPGNTWWHPHMDTVKGIAHAAQTCAWPQCDLPFVSIDSASTHDIDDAFFAEQTGTGFNLTLALAAPALFWPFDSPIDKVVQRRATSLYLPEGTCHMLPEPLGTGALSLSAGQVRPALCIRLSVDSEGEIGQPCEIFTARVRLAANLNYLDCQAVLDAVQSDSTPPDNAAKPFIKILRAGFNLARLRQQIRIAAGAVVMNRPEPTLRLEGQGADTIVVVEKEPPAGDAQSLVAEMMILASGAVADWAAVHNCPLLYRTQDVTLPKEYAGIWTKPEDMARIMRALTPSILEIHPKRHAGLAIKRYAPITSPLRRYTDLVNQAQIAHFLDNDKSIWNEKTLTNILAAFSPALEAAGQAQRFRPRYWKLLYFSQQGEKIWWPGVITEENEAFVSVNLPDQGIFVRGRRQIFDGRAVSGMHISVRLGKINPLYNEVQILEATS